MDEKYCDDPEVFYFDLPGKIKPTSNKLKPENVSWDVTVPIEDHDSGYLLTVFLTGYRIQYVPGGSAVPIRISDIKYPGLAVAYKSNSAFFLKDDGLSDHIALNVLPPNFVSTGKKYRQLTPDGMLGP